MKGTPTCRASRMCSRVWGMGPSSAPTTRMAPSIWAAPVLGAEARRNGDRRRRRAYYPAVADGGRRHDRRGRRAGRRLPRRRARARARGGRALLRAARRDAVIHVSDEVQQALRDGRGVVALETTLVAHGFPPGEGVDVGLASEQAVRDGGAVPATIGVLDGEIRVGLTEDELARFDAARASSARATWRSPSCRARSARRRSAARSPCAAPPGSASWRPAGSAACTAAGRRRPTSRPTCRRSRRRRRSSSPPASSRCSTCPATAELLETLGVPVLGFRTDSLPLFYSARGGPPVSARVESADEAAQIARAHWELGGGGLLARAAARREPRRRRAADRAGARRRRGRRRARPGGDAVRPLLPAPRERRAHAGREPRPDRRRTPGSPARSPPPERLRAARLRSPARAAVGVEPAAAAAGP